MTPVLRFLAQLRAYASKSWFWLGAAGLGLLPVLRWAADVKDVGELWTLLVENWSWLVSLAHSPYFAWCVAAVALAILCLGIRHTIMAEDRKADDLARRLEEYSRQHYEPKLDAIAKDVDHMRSVTKKMAAHFALINDIQQAERLLASIRRHESTFDAVVAQNRELPDGSIRRPLENWQWQIRDDISSLYQLLKPYMARARDFTQVSQVEMDSVDKSSYPDNLQPHLVRDYAWWSIMKGRIASLQQNPLKKMRQKTQPMDQFLIKIDEAE